MSDTLPTTTDLLDWALYYHRCGYSIIPANPETKKPCLKTWEQYQTERPTEQQVHEWFGRKKYGAIAIVLGAVSGNLAALDLDSPERYEWFSTTHLELARTLPTETTSRPGWHLFFRCNPTGTQRPKGQKVELLCTGAYVIVTPSPGKRWVKPLYDEVPQIDPFALGLDRFGIIRRDRTNTTPFTEETEGTEEPEEAEGREEIAWASSLSSVNSPRRAEEVQERIDAAIARTLPTDVGQRERCILALCQWLKAIPQLKDRQAAQLKPTAQKWHAAAYPAIGTKAFEATWQDFVYAWNHVKWPKELLLGPAVQRAREDTLNPPEAADYEDPRTQLLVRICWQLQQVHGDQPFYLSGRKAGELVGVSGPTAGKKLEMLIADGILAIASSHTNIFATRYKYIGKHSQD